MQSLSKVLEKLNPSLDKFEEVLLSRSGKEWRVSFWDKEDPFKVLFAKSGENPISLLEDGVNFLSNTCPEDETCTDQGCPHHYAQD